MRVALALFLTPVACAASSAPPVPNLSPERRATTDEVSVPTALAALAAPTQTADSSPRPTSLQRDQSETVLEGNLVQGGVIFGRTPQGSQIILDDRPIPVDENGNFVFGFGRDHGDTAELVLVRPDGTKEPPRTLEIAPQQWLESSIQVAENKANPFTQEDLSKIAADRSLKDEARARLGETVHWTSGFVWPAEGCISSPFGYRRIVNGTPRRYHSGTDVAAPDGMSPLDYVGAEIIAPADGTVTLASDDMFFEGGLVFIDHGQKLESALMHMSEVLVETGDFVRQGDIIGRVGSTGRVTGPHLHWSLKWQERLLDPELLVEDRPRCTPGL
ncbi:Peptidase M23B [Parvularcula bermudensis HTCC2503]|uniref:Peptidase M23B n=1 Tax=Parvularcula bermudensis (strain ATCC BAA-594 / HTCC2503 / KCTC 12087) TaxID=314260 RepID=E0TGN3_PARBH|nr:M23 family metallopeptidase [Parvularcula bermudensis]ADM10165.1 Peptidase M23B [Parvularcula bermudensis HTCC2503]